MTTTANDDGPAVDLRERVLMATLPHVAFDGWTQKALEAAVESLGLPKTDAKRAFPRGPAEAVAFHAALADRDMVARFEALDPPPARTRDKVAALIRLRLEAAASNREAVRLGLGLLARPQHAPLGLKSLAKTADAIWRAAGDRSADFNWYTKRGLVSAVYMSTTVYWLNDRSEETQDTWTFLDRRLDDAMKLPMRAKGVFEKMALAMPRPGRVASQVHRRRAAGGW